MNSTTLWIIIAVLVVLAFYFYNRSRKAWEVAAGAVEDAARS